MTRNFAGFGIEFQRREMFDIGGTSIVVRGRHETAELLQQHPCGFLIVAVVIGRFLSGKLCCCPDFLRRSLLRVAAPEASIATAVAMENRKNIVLFTMFTRFASSRARRRFSAGCAVSSTSKLISTRDLL